MPIPENVKTDVNSRLEVDRVVGRDLVSNILPDITNAELDAALSGIDQDALWDAEAVNAVPEVWDRVSDINGVPAATVLSRRTDIPASGDVVLIRDADGRVVIFQPHEPSAESFVPIPDGDARGLQMSEALIAGLTEANIAAQIVELVNQARASV